MTAREMFRELGFELPFKTHSIMDFTKESDLGSKEHVVFDLNKKVYWYALMHPNFVGVPLKIYAELHKAIHKQMEELGWI